jgi:hypothetical protein
MRDKGHTATILLVALVLAPGPTAGTQQTPEPAASVASILVASGTGSIAGVVRSSGPDQVPIRRARVWIGRTVIDLRQATTTDDQGRFAFTGLPAGRFLIEAEKPPFLNGAAGARTPGGPGVPLALTDGQVIRDVLVVLTRGAVIAGRIVDAHGAPAADASVSLATRRLVDGEPVLRTLATTSTDDLGEYRFYGRRPGRYVVIATPPVQGAGRVPTAAELQWARRLREPAGLAAGAVPAAGPTMTSARIAYPGVTDFGAAAEIIVTAGQERTGVDFALRFVAAASVSGRVLRSNGETAAGAQVTLSPAFRQVRTDAEGRFSFAGLQPQTYVIAASGADLDEPQFARTTVAAGGSAPTDVTLTLQPGGTVTGRVVAEPSAGGAPIAIGRVSVRLLPAGVVSGAGPGTRSSLLGTMQDGSFRFSRVAPGTYRVAVSIASTTDQSDRWVQRSAMLNGADVIDSPFEVGPGSAIDDIVVALTDRVTELSGTLVDQAGLPAPELFVAVFPIDAAHWRESSRRMVEPSHPDSAGRFVFTGLPPGGYYLAVVNDLVEDWHAPEYLEQVIPGALRVTLRDGQRVVQDIRLAQ